MKHKIVLLPFPFDDFSDFNVRPAICLTDRITGYNQVVVAFITSRTNVATEPSDLIISSEESTFSTTGLRVNSAIRLHRLVTIPTRIISRTLGELPLDYRADLEQKLRGLLGL